MRLQAAAVNLSVGILMRLRSVVVLLVALSCSVSLSALMDAQAESNEREYLLGDLGGLRDQWSERGLELESILTADLFRNTRGGGKRASAAFFNYDLAVTVDTEKAGAWNGGTFFAYYLGNFGDEISSEVGDLQGLSNIQAPHTFKLYEAWYNHDFFDGRVSLLFGLHDYNSEFDALEHAGALINSSFGISPDIAQVGPSIFPTTSLATRLRLQLTEEGYLIAAVYDGVPGDPNDSSRTQIRFDSGDGVFSAIETGWVTSAEPVDSDYHKVALGGWYHTAEFEDFSSRMRDSNHGLYGIAEKTILEDDDGGALGLFLQSGTAQGDRNQVQTYFGGGLTYYGPLKSRPDDTLSLGLAYARLSSDFRRSLEASDNGELALEANYRFQLTPYLAVQPDLQFIHNPGADPELSDALVVGVRSEVSM